MSISNFVLRSLHQTYKNLPTLATASGLSAGVSYVANRFGSRFITLPAPGTAFKFSAAAYASWMLFKAFREEMTSDKSSYFEEDEQSIGVQLNLKKLLENASHLTAIAVGACLVNAKFNPESTLLSFVKLSVTAAASLFATKFTIEIANNFGEE
jgi:hypothetical protein